MDPPEEIIRWKAPTPEEVAVANFQQLQKEVKLSRMKVSEASQELMKYIEEHQNEDYLVKGFESSPKKNPFRKKKPGSCTIV